MSEGVELRRATDADAEEAAEVFISSRRTALPTVPFVHTDDEVRGYVRNILIAKTEGWVAVDAGRVVAIMSLKPGWVDQLYVATDWHSRGVEARVTRSGQGAQRRRASAVDVSGQRPRAPLLRTQRLRDRRDDRRRQTTRSGTPRRPPVCRVTV